MDKQLKEKMFDVLCEGVPIEDQDEMRSIFASVLAKSKVYEIAKIALPLSRRVMSNGLPYINNEKFSTMIVEHTVENMDMFEESTGIHDEAKIMAELTNKFDAKYPDA